MDGEYLFQVLLDGWESEIVGVECRARGFFSVRLKWGCCGLVSGTEVVWGMLTTVACVPGVRVMIYYRVLPDGVLVREGRCIDAELGLFDRVIVGLEEMGWGVNVPGGVL